MSLNLAEFLELSALANPDKVGVVFESTRITFGELYAMAQRVSNMLRDKAIGRGDRVALMLPNVPQFPMVYYGGLNAGATVVPLNPIHKASETLDRLRDSGAKMLFVWRDFAEEAFRAAEQAEDCAHVVVVEPGPEPEIPAAGESFMSLMTQASPEFGMAQTQPEDTAVILYTSAKPGLLSGAKLSHYNLFQNALTIKEFVLQYNLADVCLSVLPLFHSFGQTTMMNAPVFAQSTIILEPRFDPGRIFEVIEKQGVTLLALVPTLFQLMLSYKPAESFDLSSVRNATSGGAKLPLELGRQFKERFGTTILEGYGLTETSPVVSFNRNPETNRPGSVGTPIWGCRVGIRRDDGQFAATGEEGEIVIRGHNVMKGYHNQPEATVEAVRGDWLHTGDLGKLDEDGFLYVTGLKKDLIINSGMNVFPWEVEKVLLAHPSVAEAAVVGMPDALRGESVTAFVVAAPGQTPSAKVLKAHCREHVASYKLPRRYHIVEALPRSDGGTVDKVALREGR